MLLVPWPRQHNVDTGSSCSRGPLLDAAHAVLLPSDTVSSDRGWPRTPHAPATAFLLQTQLSEHFIGVFQN
ncbi:mCG1029127 [Mus musculus]|nr:mCG1029127 [Mus musculus]